jgi:uncharacterized RDD family membrane protein YckC
MGWYPDPADARQERYWDGAMWTRNTRIPELGEAPQPSRGPSQEVPAPRQPGYDYRSAPPQPASPAPRQPTLPGSLMAGLRLAQPQTADGVPLASWGSRLGAWALDLVLIVLMEMALMVPFWSALSPGLSAWANDWMSGSMQVMPTDARYGIATTYYLYQVCCVFAALMYSTVLMALRGGSVGMLVLRLRVVPLDQGLRNRGLPWGVSLLRNVVWYVMGWLPLFGPLLLVASALLPLVHPKRQTMHDLLARTQVVRLG